ncbi:MAG: hypothetical protein AB7F59_14965 [Bdellovibrionales bacterium]
MRKIIFIVAALALVSVSEVNAEENSMESSSAPREISGVKDFSKEYLEQITDERAVELEASRQDQEEHERYLRKIARGR